MHSCITKDILVQMSLPPMIRAGYVSYSLRNMVLVWTSKDRPSFIQGDDVQDVGIFLGTPASLAQFEDVPATER